jgi:hypothetical protein
VHHVLQRRAVLGDLVGDRADVRAVAVAGVVARDPPSQVQAAGGAGEVVVEIGGEPVGYSPGLPGV